MIGLNLLISALRFFKIIILAANTMDTLLLTPFKWKYCIYSALQGHTARMLYSDPS